MAETAQEIVDRELREFKRYTGDDLPNPPVNAPLPVGDPQSGIWNPKKVNLRNAMLSTLTGAGAEADRARTEADRAESEADRAGGSASSAAASAAAAGAASGRLEIGSFAELSTKFVYSDPGAGQQQVADGDVITWRETGFAYRVAASGATDAQLDYSGIGGVKLYVLRDAVGAVSPQMWGGTGSEHIQAAIEYGEGGIILPPGQYDLDAPIRLRSHRKLMGFGRATLLKWVGPIDANVIEVFDDNFATVGLSNVGLDGFHIEIDDVEGVTGVKWIYATNQSYARDVSIISFGVNQTGFYVSKTWYARFDTISVRGSASRGVQAGSKGIVFAVTEGQVNAVTLINPQSNHIETGFELDTRGNYIYAPTTIGGTFENGVYGIRHISGDDGQGVRQAAFVGTYLEKNSVYDIWWGSDDNRNDVTRGVTWQGCCIFQTGVIRLDEGIHYFRACERVNNLIVNGRDNSSAFALVEGQPAPASITGTWTSNVRVVGFPTSTLSIARYGSTRARPAPAESVHATIASGSSSVDVPYPEFLANGQTEGVVLKVFVTTRRSYETTLLTSNGYLVRNASGTWGYKHVSGDAIGGAFNVTALAAGGVVVTDTRTDPKFVTVQFAPI